MSVKKLIAGKHSCVGHLSSVGTIGSDTRLDRPCLLVYCGSFESMDGPVEVTEDHIDMLIQNHNARLDRAKLSANGDELALAKSMPPLQVDHSTSALMTVGRVVGRLSKSNFTDASGNSVASLMCDGIRILGKENVEKVADGRWANVSIGADLETGMLNELSITPFPAASNATLLSQRMGIAVHSKGEYKNVAYQIEKKTDEEKYFVFTMGKQIGNWFKTADEAKVAAKEAIDLENKGAKMKEKLKKHLMDVQKMSEEDADKKLAAMEEGSEEFKKLAAECEETEKLAADKKEEEKLASGYSSMKYSVEYDEKQKHYIIRDEEKGGVVKVFKTKEEAQEFLDKNQKKLASEKDAEDKELAAKEEEAKKLAEKEESDKKELTAKKAKIVELAKGFKTGISSARLEAKKSAVTARLSRLQACAKITPAERKKMNLEELSKRPEAELEAVLSTYENREPVIDARVHGTTRAVNLAKMESAYRLARLEAETKKDMGMPLTDQDKKALEGEQTIVHIDTTGHEHSDQYMSELEGIVGDHEKKDAIMALVKKMVGTKAADPVETPENNEKQMSALAENVNRLQTQFQDLIKLIGESAGIDSAELE